MKLGRHTTSIALVALACGLGAYAWIDRGSVSQTERAMRASNVFPAWRREDLTRIELEHGGEKVVLVRSKDDAGERAWRMASPRNDEVDAALVDRFLGTLEFATVVRKVEGDPAGRADASPASDWSASRARARGLVAMEDVVYRFELGPAAPNPEGASYFRMNGEPVIVVGKELAADLMKGADAFRTRTIVPYLSLDLQKLEVRGGSAGFAVERQDERHFLVSGKGLRASRERLDRVWRAFGEMRAEAFVPDDEAQKAVAAPAMTIVMTPKDGRTPGELVIGGACPGHPEDVVVVRRAPAPSTAACAPRGVLDGLGATPESLVDRRLFWLHDDEIEAARIEGGSGAVIDIARKGSGWRELAPSPRDLTADEAEAAGGLAAALARAEGEIVGGEDKSALVANARGSVKIAPAEGGREESVRVDARAGYAVRDGDHAVFKLTPAVARKLEPRATSLRGLALWSEPIAGRPIVAIDTRCDGVRQHVSRDGDGWRLDVDGAPFRPDAGAILDAVDQLSRARADAWVADADDGTFGLSDAKGACEIHLTYVEGSSPQSPGRPRTVGVTFGAEGEGGAYARLDGDPAIFVAPSALRARVAPLFVDRHALVVDPYALFRVEVTRGGARRSFDPHTPDDAGILLGDEVATIVAEVVHLGPARAGEGFDAPVEVTFRLVPDAGRADMRFSIGAEIARGGRRVRLVRAQGLDATLAVPREAVARLLGDAR